MADHGHELTDEILNGLERRIADEFARAVSDMEQKCEDYFKADEDRREKEWDKLKAGEITEKPIPPRQQAMLEGKKKRS